MRRRRKLWAAGVGCGLWMAGVTVGWGAGEGEVLLTQVQELKALGNRGAEAGWPVRIEGVVTAWKPFLFVVQDASGAVYADPAHLEGAPVQVGMRVRLNGRSGKGGFAPIVVQPEVTVLGPGAWPEPRALGWDHLFTGREDNAWVEVEGVVRSVASREGQWYLELAGRDRRFAAWCLRSAGEDEPQSLVDAEVRLRGVYQVVFNAEGQLTGFQLQVPGLEHVQVARAAPADPWAGEVRPVRSLLRFSPDGGAGHRVRLRGQVTFHEPGEAVYLRDETGGVRVESTSPGRLEPGAEVRVAGFPEAAGHPAVLEDAIWQQVGRGEEPRPVPVGVEDLDTGAHAYELVGLEGVLLNVVTGATVQRLTLRSAERVYEAHYVGTDEWVRGLLPGSTLAVTGIGLVDYDRYGRPRSLGVRLRGQADVVVRQRPRWWTWERLLMLVGALGGVTVLTTVWGAALRLRVKAQTAELRRQLERETELERDFRTLAESSPVGIWQTGETGETVYRNEAMRRLLGRREAEEMAGLTWEGAFPGRGRAGAPGEEAGAARGERFEAEVEGSDGQLRHLLITGAPLVGTGGKVEGMIHCCEDVTDQKRAVAEAAAAREAAEAANRTKSLFLATMSHELRTPLNGVLGAIELLQRTSLTPGQRDLLEDGTRSGRVLVGLVNDILDFVRLSEGELVLEDAVFELMPLIEEILERVRGTEGAKPVPVVAEWGAEVPARVRGDAGRLRQVLEHLVDNAYRFTATGKITVRVSAVSREEGRARLRIEVADTGMGMSEAQQRRLFEPFAQGDTSESRRFGGAGLGLAICRQLVSRMGGTIGVESRWGEGSTFRVDLTLPVAEEEAPPRGWRVLVVEANPVERRLTLLSLAKLGCRAEAVATGSELRDRLGAEDWDVALITRHLPDMRFEECLAALGAAKGSGRNEGVRVVGLAARGSAREEEEWRAAGVTVCLVRPFTGEQLRQGLLQARGRAGGAV